MDFHLSIGNLEGEGGNPRHIAADTPVRWDRGNAASGRLGNVAGVGPPCGDCKVGIECKIGNNGRDETLWVA
ncbi:hypothetical protein D3C87_1622520 [compost metagenome]